MINIFERPYQICFSKNPIRFGLSTDADISQPGFIFEVRLMWRLLGSGSDFSEMLSIPLTPNQNKIAYINLRNLIDSRLSYNMPDMDNNQFGFCKNQCVEFYIDYREIWEGNEDVNWTDGSGNVSVAMKGGISYEKWKGGNYFVSYLQTNKDFLTWKRKQHYIQPAEITFLHYLHTGNTDTINLKITLHYTDGTTNAANYMTLISPVKYGVYSVPTGVKQLSLQDVEAGKDIYYYDVEIINAGGTLAGAYRYWVDYRTFATASFGQLTYRNSLGGLESVMVLGKIQPTNQYAFETAEQTVEKGYYDLQHLMPQYVQYQGAESRTYKAHVGFIFPDEQDRLRDAALRREIYYPKKGQWLPIEITSKQLAMATNEDMLWVMEIEFQFAYDNINYTPDEVEIGDLPACPIPQALSVSNINNKVVTLTWTGSGSAIGYVIEASGQWIYRSSNPDIQPTYGYKDWAVVGSTASISFQYDASDWFKVHFRVKANCNLNESGYSNEVTVSP